MAKRARPLSIIIDTDPGLDDAVAIALAVASAGLSVEAVTSVAGNAPIEMVTRNARGIVAALGAAIPVHQGSARPVVLPLRTSAMLWGGDGDLGLKKRAPLAGGHAVLRLMQFLEGAPRRSRTLVAIGPLTNLGVLLVMRPDLGAAIREIVIMGGGLDHGNATPQAELNIWVDPHAAHTVFSSGVPIVLATLDITEPLKVPPGVARELKSIATPSARLVSRLLPLSGSDSHPSSIYDAATIAWLLWPELFEVAEGTVSVVIEGGEELGRTIFHRGRMGPHRVLTGVDNDRFFERLVEGLGPRQ